MPALHETRGGQEFLFGTVPRIADALVDIARNTKALVAQGQSAYDKDKKLVIHDFSDQFKEMGISEHYPVGSTGWCQDLILHINSLDADKDTARKELLDILQDNNRLMAAFDYVMEWAKEHDQKELLDTMMDHADGPMKNSAGSKIAEIKKILREAASKGPGHYNDVCCLIGGVIGGIEDDDANTE